MLRVRIATAVVLMLLFGFDLFLASVDLFALSIAGIVAAGAWEWSRLAGVTGTVGEVAYASVLGVATLVCLYLPPSVAFERWAMLVGLLFWMAVPAVFALRPVRTPIVRTDRLMLVLGAIALVLAALAIQYLRDRAPLASPWLLLYALGIVWLMDIGAYFAGRRFGKRKLSPLISPGKSWEGVWGGLAVTVLAMIAVLIFAPLPDGYALKLTAATLLAAGASVIGDLYESRAKRGAGRKDSSRLLPGHGGVLDRIDGVLAAMPVFAFVWAWV